MAWAPVLPGVFDDLIWLFLPHACLLTRLVGRYLKKEPPAARIDGLLVAALI